MRLESRSCFQETISEEWGFKVHGLSACHVCHAYKCTSIKRTNSGRHNSPICVPVCMHTRVCVQTLECQSAEVVATMTRRRLRLQQFEEKRKRRYTKYRASSMPHTFSLLHANRVLDKDPQVRYRRFVRAAGVTSLRAPCTSSHKCMSLVPSMLQLRALLLS
jgi:hypothetical protein